MSGDLIQATVFYSWESDLNGRTTRNLIEGCLNTVIRQLGREDDLDVDPSLDRDTRGVSGAPVILDAILEKIDNCTAFVADVSIINSADVRHDPPARPTPNPNVLIELGYAIKTLSWDRILPICNTFYGSVDQLPFDIPERRVIAYKLSEDPTPEEVKAAKEQLTSVFKSRLRDILKLRRESILDIQLGDADTEELFGHELDCQLYEVHFSDYPDNRFPDHERYISTGMAGMQMRDTNLNREYFRDVATYTDHRNITQRFAFVVVNNSKNTLQSPRLEVVIETPESGVAAFDEDSFPDVPDESIFANVGPHHLLAKQNRRNFATVKRGSDKTIIRADLEDIQAKRTAWSSCCYIGAGVESLSLNCRLYADNLSEPFEQQIVMRFAIGKQSKTLQEWIDAEFTATPIETSESTDESEK